ncbi:MAG: stage III sporulation protein AA [Bacillota bacterium]
MFDWHNLSAVLPADWHPAVLASDSSVLGQIQELRIRCGQPVLAYGQFGEMFLTEQGLSPCSQRWLVAGREHVQHILATISRSSLYALGEELRSGYLTIQGGHRIGLVGRAVVEQGRVKTLKYITGFNVRLAREVKGCSTPLLPILQDGRTTIYSTLVVSPPQAGKTTLLRDLARALSSGDRPLQRAHKVVVVDERSELGACWQGMPQLDLGPRCDVLDACPKAEGMMMALRALSPEVLVTDEIGRWEDAAAIEEALNCGVTVIASAHGASLEDLTRRPGLRRLLQDVSFERFIVLSSRRGPGTVEAVLDERRHSLL